MMTSRLLDYKVESLDLNQLTNLETLATNKFVANFMSGHCYCLHGLQFINTILI